MTDKGTCPKHGEFILTEGCRDCLQVERGRWKAESLAAAAQAAGAEVTVAKASFRVEPQAGLAEEMAQCSHGFFVVNMCPECIAEEAEPAVALRPGEDLETHGYFEESMKLLEYAEKRVIATIEDSKAATDDLSIISKLKKLMDAKRKALLEPLEAQKVTIRDTYTYLMTPILEADKITRAKMIAFDAEQRRIRQEQEEINRLREEAAQKQKELTGETTEVETVEVSPEAPKRVSTELGSAGMTDHWKWEVIDFNLVPDEYKMIDGPQLTAISKSHHDKKLVAGVRFYNEPIIAVRAR